MFSSVRFRIRSLSLFIRPLSQSHSLSQQTQFENHSLIDPETKTTKIIPDHSVELNTFRKRFAVPITDISVIQRALTHRSYLRANPGVKGLEHNDRYVALGQTVMTQFLMEYLFFKYPKLSSSALSDCHNFIVDVPQLARTARHIGAQELYLTDNTVGDSKLDVGLAEALLAIVGSVYVDQGPLGARKLVREFVLYSLKGRDVYEIIKLEHPVQILQEILAIKGLEKPRDELLWETGRGTENAIFCVSVISGEKKLSEGVGQTMERARHNGYQTAVLELFPKELQKCKPPSEQQGSTYNFNTKI